MKTLLKKQILNKLSYILTNILDLCLTLFFTQIPKADTEFFSTLLELKIRVVVFVLW